MSRYEPLYNYLKSYQGTSWNASFSEVERILGFPLPQSAGKHQAWWANQSGAGHTQSRAWQDAGWRTKNLDVAGRRVDFERVAPLSSSPSPALSTPKRPENGTWETGNEEELVALAHERTGISDRAELIREAMRALIQREGARRLARLGGTMPDFRAPPRRRLDEL